MHFGMARYYPYAVTFISIGITEYYRLTAMSEGNFRKVCITLRGDQVRDLKSRSRNVSKMIRDAIDYYLTLDIGSSDIAIYEMRRDVKKLLEIVEGGKAKVSAKKKQSPAKSDGELGDLARIVRDEKDERIMKLMLEKGHENTRNIVEALGYSRTESVRDKLNSLNARAQEEYGRPLFRYFRSKDGFDYSWWLMVDQEELESGTKPAPRAEGK